MRRGTDIWSNVEMLSDETHVVPNAIIGYVHAMPYIHESHVCKGQTTMLLSLLLLCIVAEMVPFVPWLWLPVGTAECRVFDVYVETSGEHAKWRGQ